MRSVPTRSLALRGAYLAVVEDDGTDEPPSAAGHLAPVHQVLQLGDLHCALEPETQDKHTVSASGDVNNAARALQGLGSTCWPGSATARYFHYSILLSYCCASTKKQIMNTVC